MNLAHFYNMIQFSGQKGSTGKKPAAATKKEAATIATAATTPTTTTATAKISKVTAATANQQQATAIMSAANAAVGYSNGIFYLPHEAISSNRNNNSNNNVKADRDAVEEDVGEGDAEEEEEDEDEDEDSLASMETLSDNVSIWVDGEQRWVSGVDANTTCSDLINALLSFHDGPKMSSSSTKAAGNSAINQSTLNTKEEEEEEAAAPAASQKPRNADAFSGCSHNAARYVIVRQQRHCEELLDGSTKVFDLLPPTRDAAGRKEQHQQQLFLRRLTPSHAAAAAPAAGLGSLLSTDKDSGMGSPVGSSRSARLRRKKHKSTVSWLAQGNTLHPKLAQRGGAANERLMKIIIAQDETIHRQLTLLREKERQISKIEEENHRTRERELGKNYLLETYLKGLDEAATGADLAEGEEIFIDEPFVGGPTTTTTTTTKLQEEQQQQERRSKHHKQRSSKHTKQSSAHKKKREEATKHVDSSAAAAAAAGGSDLEEQLLWTEKLCSINKQLQREEELLLKLHSKIRKHQAKRAHRSRQQLQQQIDDLDGSIAAQAADIRRNEERLAASDEQLLRKVSFLERLSVEVDADGGGGEQQPKRTVLTAAVDLLQPGCQQSTAPATEAVKTTATFALNAMQSAEDLLSLQQLIAKPQEAATTTTTTKTTATGSEAALTAATTASVDAANYDRINHASSAATKASCTAALLQLQQRHQQQQQQHHLNDKLHALHMKTVKKQMFSPTAPLVGLPSSSPPPPAPLLPPPTQPTLLFLGDSLDFSQIGTLV